MGVISLHSLDDYWSTDPIISHPWFRCVLSWNRFRQILQYLHIVDNSTAPQQSDPNYDKVRPLLVEFANRSLELYSPHRQLSIDESMIGTKCRL